MRWDKETSKVNPSADRKVMSIDPTTGKPAYVVLGEMQDYMSSLFKGVAQPSTVPQIIENVKYAYFAFELGTYENFLGIDGLALEININEFGVFIWEGTYWTKHVVQVDLTDYMRISGLNSVIEQLNFDELKLIENSEEKTLAVLLPDGKQLLLNKALDDHYFNADIVQMVKGDVVSLVSGESKGVQLTDPNDPELAKSAIGIVIDDTVPVGGKVLIRKIGVLGGLSALNYLAGQLTYVDPENPGKWTTIKPTTGTYIITACRIIDTESVDVQIAYQPMLGDLSDVATINENIPIVKKGGIFKSEKTALDIESVTPASGKFDVNGNLEVSKKATTKNLEVGEDATVIGDLNAGNITSTGGFKKVDRTNSDLLLAGGGHLPILELKAGIYQLFNPTDKQEVVLEVNAAGQVIIRADIIHEGSQYETHAENINTPQSVITLRDGALSGLNLNELAGFVIRKYDGTNDGMIVIDKDGVLRIGDVGSLQPVMTREETPVDYSPTFFNPATLRAETLPGTTTKNDLVDADAVMIKDSADSNKPKWWTWARIKANLKAYFDTLYIALSGNQVISGIKTFLSSPIVPDPVNGTDGANKRYVDSVIVTQSNVEQVRSQETAKVPSSKVLDDELKEVEAKASASIASLENVLNSMNVNQESTATTSGVDVVSLPKKAANGGMGVQMFGQSAENLVVNGDFRNGTTGILSLFSTISASGGILSVTGTGANANVRFGASITPQITGNKLYFKSRLRVTNSVCTNISAIIRNTLGNIISSNTVTLNTPTSNEWYNHAGILTVNADYAISVIEIGHQYADSATANGKVMEVDYFEVINLTAIGLDSLTKEQCDVLFANYFEGTDNVLGTGRVRSVGKNLLDSSRFSSRFNGVTVPPTSFTVSSETIVMNNSTEFGCGLSQKIKLYAGVYRFSVKSIIRDAGTAIVSLFFRDANNNNILSTSVENGTITVTDEHSWIIDRVLLFRAGSVGTKNVTITGLQVERSATATTYEPYRQTILQLTTPELRSNGLIKDEIRKGSNGYELVKRVGVGTLGANGISGGDFEGGLIGTVVDGGGSVSTWTLNTVNPISGTQDGLLSVTTAGTIPNRPILVIPLTRSAGQLRKLTISYKNISGISNVASINTGASALTGAANLIGTGQYVFYYVCDGTGGLNILFDGTKLFSIQLDNIKDELVNTPDGTGTGSTVTVIGSNIHYTLATPTITPIAHAGLLNSNNNGTAYFEPIIADAGVYGNNITIQLTDYPISTFEQIVKRVNGVNIPLDISTAVIAANGLSFTHPGLASGDLVMFTYFYNRESIGRSMTLTYYDSRYVVADSVNGKFYRWVVTSANGVLSLTPIEV